MKAAYTRYILDFKVPGGTSRGILTQKETWFVRIWHDETPWIFGIGECALFRGLSADDRPGYEEKLKEVSFDIPIPTLLLICADYLTDELIKENKQILALPKESDERKI